MSTLDELAAASANLCDNPGHIALLHALRQVFTGADLIEAEAVADHLEDLGAAIRFDDESNPNEVLAFDTYRTNGELIAAVARLGYLRSEDYVLDPTWGRGTFWKVWQPELIQGCDLDPAKSPLGESVDFTALPWPARHFDAVVFDPPYKLNGTPTHGVDERFGVHEPTTRAERERVIFEGLAECCRVARRTVLVKVQDQVNGGKIRWQTDECVTHAARFGFVKVDELVKLGGRAQPAGRRQVHARRNGSTLLVLERTDGVTQEALL